MKILFIGKRYHSNQHFAMKSLVAQGHKVEYFVQNIGPSENHGVLLPKRIPYSNVFLLIELILYRFFGYKISRPNYGFPQLINFYRDIKRFDPDVILVRTARLYSQLATLIARILRKPVVLDTYSPLDPGFRNKRTSSPARRAVTKLAIRPRVSFTPVSGILFGPKPTRHGTTYHIPLVVESSRLDRLRTYRKDGTIKILSVGKYQDMDKKRHDLLIQAVRDLLNRSYNISLTFIGSGRDMDPRLRYLMNMVQKFNLNGRVRFRLNIPHEKMHKLYAEHDVFVLASRREAYGYSVLEAMGTGLPVIASDRAGASDCIEDGINGYIFKSDDLDSLTSAIEKIVRDHDLLEKMGAASLEIVKKRYLPHVYHDRLMYLLKEEFGLVDSKCSSRAEASLRIQA